MIYPDKRLFVHTVVIQIDNGIDDWGKHDYTNYTLTNVRFIRKNIYSGTGNAQQLLGTGTIFILPKFTQLPDGLTIDDSLRQAIVMFGGHQYKIVNVAFNNNLYDDGIYSYELGVM
ncbi:MAG: putative minor capsid protein [Oenococcus sp.]|uniref:putative minor capsid protein n=1 Tax=Oenococcus sp. TaxID=1979414 RepID=UPI0039ECCF57